MSYTKHASKRRRRSKALPILGAAGLSLSLAAGASATPAGSAGVMPTTKTGNGHDVSLGEEEISDVTLATFYIFDKEGDVRSEPNLQFVRHGCGGCHGCGGHGHGCGHGCGGCRHGCGGCGHGCGHGCGGCVGIFFGGCGGCGGCGASGYWCWINGVQTWCPYDYGY